MQLEALECGAASLCMILAYYGKWIPIEQVREDCGVSRDGSNARNILKAARFYGLDAKGYRYEPEMLKQEGSFPCIIHWNFNHFVVLDGFRNNKDTPDFAGRESAMQYIIDNHPNMKQLPLREQYEMAYLISRGVDSMKQQNAPEPQMSVEDEVARISKNPEIMRRLSEMRARDVAEKQNNTPPAFIASQGNARVSANVPERPESFDDAYAMAKKRLAEV